MKNPSSCFNSSLEVIRLAVMMYIQFPLSLRQVENFLFERGIYICYEAARFWCNRFGPMYAAEIGRRRQQSMRAVPKWLGHQDKGLVKIDGETYSLWRAVDHEGEVLEVYATKRRDRKAALKFLKRAVKRYGRPKEIVTFRLRSYGAALKTLSIANRQLCGRWLKDRTEKSYQPF